MERVDARTRERVARIGTLATKIGTKEERVEGPKSGSRVNVKVGGQCTCET